MDEPQCFKVDVADPEENNLLLVKRVWAFYYPPSTLGVAFPEGQARFLPLAAIESGTGSTFPVSQAPFTRVDVLPVVFVE